MHRLLDALDPEARAALMALAQPHRVQAGETLFREGEPSTTAYALTSGRCMLSRQARPLTEAQAYELLDTTAVLGGLPHTCTAIATAACEFLRWPPEALWAFPPFALAARHFLASALLDAQTRLAELSAPLYDNHAAELVPGPFRFDRVRLCIAVCDMDADAAALPAGLTLLRRPGRPRASLLLMFAQFPTAYPEASPNHRFAYDETTCFVPVRCGGAVGLFTSHIYPSAWEPILLGREIYGFPKRLGKTTLRADSANLTVDDTTHYRLTWNGYTPVRESRLVRALASSMGFDGRVTALAFRAGEALRQTLGLPAYRRVDVYNHKRILAAGSAHTAPRYDVDALTRATFGVYGWHHIHQLDMPVLTITAGPYQHANVTLREAYDTGLDMRLSAGMNINNS